MNTKKIYNLIKAFALIMGIIVSAMINLFLLNLYDSISQKTILLTILIQSIIILVLYLIMYETIAVYECIKEIMEAKE
jgi:multisubunit Na+/H+ antiporter MnhE subunit